MVLIPAYQGSLFQQEYFLHKEKKLVVVKVAVACQASQIQLLTLWIHDLREVGWGCPAKPGCSCHCSNTCAVRRDTGLKLLLKKYVRPSASREEWWH